MNTETTCTLILQLTCFKKCVTSGVGTSSLTETELTTHKVYKGPTYNMYNLYI